MEARKNEFGDSEDSKISEIFEMLEETGALEMTGVNRDGEPVYRITEKCREVFPELMAFHQAELNETANELWQLGVVDVIFRENTYAVGFTNQNYRKWKEIKNDLTNEQKDFLDVLIGFNLENLLEQDYQ